MRGLYIIVEGQTEEEFVNAVLREHFAARGIYDVRAILLNTSTTSKGGAMSFARYKVSTQESAPICFIQTHCVDRFSDG
ncbi:MAG: hypothetical protein BGO21_05095 [Dyadobacter sp. 50-39]|uniref:DUF4276 family protein n=1 Tax=Dyadobacter sp. 50-39 TaxID=1895756 RepID=UPI00095ADF95|nr:MAG: hypothetical protein BGO21_05095 [Dyadobacter sp. 50-39]